LSVALTSRRSASRAVALGVLMTVTALLSTATPARADGVPAVSVGAVTGAFFSKSSSGAFTATPSDSPVFSQTFPQINFNPPSGTVPCTNETGIDVFSRPFTDVIQQPDGSCDLIVAEGAGQQAGVGDLADFQTVFSSTITVAQPGVVTFGFFSDDGWIMGIGRGPGGVQPTYASGPLVNPPPNSPFYGYQVAGSYNVASAPTENLLGVDFPVAGSYPVEIDYTECCGGQLSFTLQANGAPIASGSCPIEIPATPPNSASTCVTADVVSTITVTAPALISFGSLAVGETSAPAAAPVNVKSNAGGYQLSVTRTAFTNGDLPLSVASAAPADPAQLLDLSGLTAIPTIGSVDIGHRSGVTPEAGDTWPLSLTLGPVPATATGTHASIVTFTAIAF
jgi:hypothetical protein